jgi:hypothetical protein
VLQKGFKVISKVLQKGFKVISRLQSALFLGEVITVYHSVDLVLIRSGVLFDSGTVEEIVRR